MSSENLSIPEEHLREVIDIIRCGLDNICNDKTPIVERMLENWCDEEEKYLDQLESED